MVLAVALGRTRTFLGVSMLCSPAHREADGGGLKSWPEIEGVFH